MKIDNSFNSLIPSQAYLYFPKGSDVRSTQSGRAIFDGNTQFDADEHAKIAELKKLAQKNHYSLSSMWTDSMILRFLYGNGYNCKKALESIKNYTQEKENFAPIIPDDSLRNYLNSGILYVHGRDCKYRPIVVFNIYMMDPKKFDYDQIIRYVTFWFEHIINEWMLPGQVENWNFIVNLKDMKVSTSTVNSLKKVFSYLQDNYKCRLHSLYMINASSSIYVPWKIVKGLLDENTVQKIHFYKTANPTALFDYTNPAQVEKQYGGFAPNLTEFWPSKPVSSDYFVSKDDEKALITKEEYISMLNRGDLEGIKVSPLILESVIPQSHDNISTIDVLPNHDMEAATPMPTDNEIKNADSIKIADDTPVGSLDELDQEVDYIDYMSESLNELEERNKIKEFRVSLSDSRFYSESRLVTLCDE